MKCDSRQLKQKHPMMWQSMLCLKAISNKAGGLNGF